MALSENLQLKLSKHYEPSSMINMTYKGNDLAVKTDDQGNAIMVFIGKRMEDGKIKGERYARTLKRGQDGYLIKDHWELKGKAT